MSPLERNDCGVEDHYLGNMRIRAAFVTCGLLTGTLVAVPGRPVVQAAGGLSVTTVLSGLSNPWDVAFAPDGAMFVTERSGRLSVRLPDGTTRRLSAPMSDLWASGETGLMGIEVDPTFISTRRIYTCQGTTDNDNTVQVVAWTVDAAYSSVSRVIDPLVGGIDGRSGRHGGCQLRIDSAGALWIGTGDAAFGTNPQHPTALAGKVLRVDRLTGAGLPGNPFFGEGGDRARIYSWGHRNVQGLAVHPGTGQVWSVEHGPDRDDEVNRLFAGGNYGWDPVPGYNESVPMTDVAKFPTAVRPAWTSGFPTVATSGATFLRGSGWGTWEGALAVSSLKDARLRIMFFDRTGTFAGQIVPPELDRTYGRLRGARVGSRRTAFCDDRQRRRIGSRDCNCASRCGLWTRRRRRLVQQPRHGGAGRRRSSASPCLERTLDLRLVVDRRHRDLRSGRRILGR